MKHLAIAGILLSALPISYASASNWLYVSFTDDSSSSKVHKASISELKRTTLGELVSDYDFEIFELSLMCEVTEHGDVIRFLDFQFDSPFAYSNAPVQIQVKVGKFDKTFDGKMRKNTVSSGFSHLTIEEFNEISDVLAKGNRVSYRIKPVENGESKGTRLTLRGSKRAIEELNPHCDVSDISLANQSL